MMRGSLKGKSRQALHEEFRQQSLRGDLEKSHDVESLVGAAPIQAKQFLDRHLRPFLKGQSKKFSVRLQSTSAEI
jgi:hypothetical protein